MPLGMCRVPFQCTEYSQHASPPHISRPYNSEWAPPLWVGTNWLRGWLCPIRLRANARSARLSPGAIS